MVAGVCEACWIELQDPGPNRFEIDPGSHKIECNPRLLSTRTVTSAHALVQEKLEQSGLA